MKKILTILSVFLIVMGILPIEAATQSGRTITLKKKPRNPKDNDSHTYKVPSIAFTYYVDKDTGIQPLDTSEIESYEVWDCTDTAPIVVYETEIDFVDYILNDDAQGIIKLFTPDYIYVGELEE